ncbi:GNAT family N-acetyltransferase [Pedobacter sp.]|jgi:ribosomal protein S18 acetylase RimI-like enzyme|uniref:GNAT family N-acetyltransferase n=1 Tax=Pedobacter sp. TaxID=1411316 RepID=UPI002B6B0817|nr:GNAT family N-acetyltransferase [Pedobacter sp.]HWW38199.1 GNAT family N-acetyltransferase [Pedobacter sp.]
MQIVNSTPKDIETIFKFYDAAVAYQKTKFNKHWQPFERTLIEKEIEENRQWKILIDGKPACIFAVTYQDPEIWGENNNPPAIYLHRIVTWPDFRGRNFVKIIADWARDFCKQHQKLFIRMDTWGDNQSLIDYYVSCGFTFKGITKPMDSDQLPAHYNAITLSLFEIEV